VKFLSICSGIEAASVAWEPLGWEAAGFSEIEPFPSAVLAHHYPDVPNLGDMTKFDTWPEEIFLEADLIVGGPPCQAFSVAGNREGLADDRGNLTLVYVQLINHADLIRKKHGKEPVIAFYENVPGLFSDKTNAFGCLLGALAGEDGALLAPGGKWTDAGCVSGPQRTMAWRLLDAQYFGLAQRRRRVFLVASARDGFNPTEILFKREGVRRDSAPSRETGQEVAGTIAARFGISRNNFEECVAAPTVIGNVEGGAATTLSSREYKGLSCGRDGMTSAAVVYEPVAYSIREDATANNFSATPLSVSNAIQALQPSVQSHHAQVFIAQAIPYGVGESPDTAHCLRAGASKADKHESTTYIAQAIPIHDQATRFAGKRGDKQDGKGNGLGIGEPGAPMNTLTKGDRHAVAHPTVLMDQGGSVMSVMEDGTVGTLRRETHGHEPVVLTPDTLYNKGIKQGEHDACTQETYAGTLLRTLLQEVGEETFAKWGLGILNSLQSSEILREKLHGSVFRPATFSRSWVVYCTLSRKKNGSCWLLQSLLEAECPRCTSQGWKPSEQYARELGAYLSELSQPGAQSQRFLQDLWQAAEGFGLLREALSKIQEMGRPFNSQTQPVFSSMQVRRLTAEECEFLQGFPRGYTNIPWRGKPEAPDGPRYKALGNSWAVPNVRWIGVRIDQYLKTLNGEVK
jgi:DNA (cytosine-5)-methyltransferase 1